nr:putative capsid protein [Poaceae Liege totivirus 15]
MSVQTAIEALGGSAAITRFKGSPIKGAFSVGASSDLRVNCNGVVYPIDVNSQVTFSSIDTKMEVFKVVGHNDLRGVNKKLIRADMDTVDTIALRSFVSKAYSVKTDLRTGWVYSAEYTPVSDSHVAFIYNMMISWYKAVLWKGAYETGDATRATNLLPATITVRRYNYKDSHVIVSHGEGEDGELDVTFDIGPPSGVDPAGDDMVHAFSFNALSSERMEVVLLPNISKHANTWYIQHLVTRTNTTPFNFDVKVPGVQLQNLSTRTTSGNDALYEGDENIDWTDADSMWYWMCSYVTENRVQSQFAAAFELFSSVAYRPVADSAEGFLYSTVPTQIYIPEPHYYRARFPGLMEDEPWMTPHDAHDMMLRTGADAHALLAMAGVSNYIAHIGAVSVASEGHMVEQNLVLGAQFAIHSNTYMERPTEHRAACIYAVLGREVFTHFTSGMGVIYPTTSYTTIGRYPFARRSSATSDIRGFDLTGSGLAHGGKMPLPASPALLYGKVSDQLTALQHCRPIIKWNFANGVDSILSLEEAFTLANLYRMAGYDSTFSCVQTGATVAPYSSLKAMSLSLSTMSFNPRLNSTYQVVDFKNRNPERLSRLPTPEVFMAMNSLHVTSDTRGYVMEVPGKRGVTIHTNYRRARTMKTIQVRVATGMHVEKVQVTRPAIAAHEPMQGFQHAEVEIHDAPQEITAIQEQE